MNSKFFNLLLSLLLVTVLGVIVLARHDSSQPNWQFLRAMKHSPAYQAHEVNTEFSNGRTLQSPVAGTIARGELPLHFEATKEDALRAGEEIVNPYLQAIAAAQPIVTEVEPLEPEGELTSSELSSAAAPQAVPNPHRALDDSVARGADLFRIYCAACHGPGGAGNGPVAQRGFPPPPPLPTGNSTRMKDGQLFHILTFGQGSMPGQAGMLIRDRRWDVINFVRTLQIPGEQTPEDQTSPVDGTPVDPLESLPDSPTLPEPDPVLPEPDPVLPDADVDNSNADDGETEPTTEDARNTAESQP